MAFKSISQKTVVPDSPDLLLRELPRRKIPDVLPHQQSIMQRYANEAIGKFDVALQLPTGSGKTLVGLLIAEWRRKKFGEKVVYLCPTKQLVHQAANQANQKYGLSVVELTGSQRDYIPSEVTKYKQGDCVAITTYNSLFNTHPFFDDADVIIIDDAHAAENYVAKLWTLNIDRQEYGQLHDVLCSILKSSLEPQSYSRLTGQVDGLSDLAWVDKLPTSILIHLHDQICEVLDEHTRNTDLKYPWSMLRDNFKACHLYMTASEIMIRPLIPPTWAHKAFEQAKQRIYMSATLGEGGDLERLLGRKSIHRLPVPDGWDTQGVGRRFFMFPSLSLDEEEIIELRRSLMTMVPRSLVLVPSNFLENEISQDVVSHLDLKVFTARDIEESKDEFIKSAGALAVVANRYDGIDFPGEECRLLMIEGLPKVVNSQERFLMARMGANILFNERIQTRVLQAIGRCTRSLEDYSAVVVTGDELPDYLAEPRRRKYFHPELQAELHFGVEQSKESTISNFKDNFKIFIENGQEWESANEMILENRQSSNKEAFPGMQNLKSAVQSEVEYQMAIWQQDYVKALNKAEEVIGLLTGSNLRGYRALWEYLAGSAALLSNTIAAGDTFLSKAREHFHRAKNATNTLHWLVKLSQHSNLQNGEKLSEENSTVMLQVERVESLLESLGNIHDRNYTRREKEILEGLYEPEKFESAHKMLGEHLGYEAGKEESDGSPDPWWLLDNTCLVFEDHANAEETSSLSATKARQVSSHPQWMRENIAACAEPSVKILPVLITPVSSAREGAHPHLGGVALWKLQDFREWASNAMGVIRELRETFVETGDMDWRAKAADRLCSEQLDILGLTKKLRSSIAKDILAKH